jgi:hypothetical protein
VLVSVLAGLTLPFSMSRHRNAESLLRAMALGASKLLLPYRRYTFEGSKSCTNRPWRLTSAKYIRLAQSTTIPGSVLANACDHGA